jgi:hypothetical protein
MTITFDDDPNTTWDINDPNLPSETAGTQDTWDSESGGARVVEESSATFPPKS